MLHGDTSCDDWVSGRPLDPSSTVRARVARIIPHPSYNPDTADFDVAVLQLDGPLPFGRHVQPVCLPAATHVFPARRKCLISGWGKTIPTHPSLLSSLSTALQKATVELLDQGLCAGLYGHSLTDRMMCAGYLDGKVDSCQVSPLLGGEKVGEGAACAQGARSERGLEKVLGKAGESLCLRV
uniref:Transmembrane serine protease 9 n=1 Tax=Canis lupus dingo TaxID=286419 RepID=A0A8C0L0K0_CANLU